jgi:2'-5' RNA ligase
VPAITAAELTTVPGVELARTGNWSLSSGNWQPTREDFHSAVAAMNCPAVRPPRIRLGHVDPRFDGEPAVGSIINLRTEYGGHSLVGDLDGLPAWFTDRNNTGHSVMSSAFPDRSVEGVYQHRCQLGHTHPFVLTGLALLGVTPPGVGTLRSLRDVGARYGVEAAPESTDGTPVSATFRASAEVHTGAMVALVPTAEHAARLAVDGGEPVEQPHLTLAYLGDAIDIDEATRRATITALAAAMTGAGTVDADGFAISVFNPSSDERDTAIVLGVGGSEVDDVQSLTVQTLAKVPGLVVPPQHLPYVAHLTLLYSDDLTLVAKLADRTGPIAFDRLRIAFGGVITDIPLGPTTVEARYNPGQLRDPGGEGGGRWTAGPLRDSLRLAGRIDLAPGESLLGSDRLNADGGTARLALTERDGERSLRLGLGNPSFGGRHDDAGLWTAGPDPTEATNAERKKLRDEADAIGAELEGVDEHAQPSRALILQARLDELNDMDLNEVHPAGYTARLDMDAVEQLRSTLSDALATGAMLQARFDGGDEPPRPTGGYFTIAEGTIRGEWADISYHVYLDDPSVGVEVHLAVIPHESGLTLDDLTGNDQAARLDVAETQRLLRILARMSPGAVAATFDPHQRRDSHGQWVDQLHTPGSPLPARQIGQSDTSPPDDFAGNWSGRMSYARYDATYGDIYDERDVDEFRVVEFENGDMHLAVQDDADPGHRYVMAELTPVAAYEIADALDWATGDDPEVDFDPDFTPPPEFAHLTDYMLVGYDTVVGFSEDGVEISFPRPDGGHDGFVLEAATAADLADALREIADLHDDRAAEEVVASTGRGSTVPETNAERVRAAWNDAAPHEQWVTEIAPDLSYVVVVSEPERRFTRHQVHVSAAGQITFGRGRPIRLGYVDASGAVTAQRTVFASRAESRPVAASEGAGHLASPPAPGPVTELPAAEPEEPTTEPKEGDLMSTLSTDVRSRLGLPDDADDAAVVAALDALKTKAETPPPAVEPDPALVAASAATVQERDELKKEVTVLASRLDEISGELAKTKAEKAATVKASVLSEARRLGKYAPADEARWSSDYDDAPAVITRVLASIAPGTAVPVSAAGETGAPEPTGTDGFDAEYDRLFGEKASA